MAYRSRRTRCLRDFSQCNSVVSGIPCSVWQRLMVALEDLTDFRGSYSLDEDILRKLEERLGPLHARQRLGIERDHEAQVFGQGLTLFHFENLYLAPAIIRNALKLTGLYWRARRNAQRIIVKRNGLRFAALPPLFDGYTILHISDMHVDMNEAAMQHLIELVGGMRYDLCVLTGDYRGKTFGPFDAALEGVAKVRAHLKGPVYFMGCLATTTPCTILAASGQDTVHCWATAWIAMISTTVVHAIVGHPTAADTDNFAAPRNWREGPAPVRSLHSAPQVSSRKCPSRRRRFQGNALRLRELPGS